MADHYIHNFAAFNESRQKGIAEILFLTREYNETWVKFTHIA